MSLGFVEDLFFLLEKLKKNENFAFVRYSDGEVFVMQNKHLILISDTPRTITKNSSQKSMAF